MTDNDLLNDGDPFREELVAYLDGELDAERSRKIEERAATDPDTRRTLEELDRSWHLLDDIEASITNEDFTRTTLEMVALAAADDAKRAKAEAPRRRSRRWLIALASVVAASLAGFGLVYAFIPDPNAQILHDLPLLENLDQYRQVDNIRFLRALASEKRFAGEADDVQSMAADESIAQRKQQIVDMTPAQKEEILRRDERFLTTLSDAERQNIRTLHEQIRSAPDSAKLRETMNRYCQWLSDLSPFTRAQISQQKPEQRIVKVREIVGKQSHESENRLSDKDRLAVVRWMETYATENEPRVLEFLNDRFRGPPPAENPTPAQRHRMAIQWLLHHWQMAIQPPVSDAEIAKLKNTLSPTALDKLNGKKPVEQTQIVSQWLRDVAHQESANRRNKVAMMLPGYNEQLGEFFEKLSDKDQNDLMAMPGEQMQQQLWEKYLQQVKPGEGWQQRHPDRPGRGGKRPGFGGPGLNHREPKDTGDDHPGKDHPDKDGPRPNDRPPPPDGPPI